MSALDDFLSLHTPATAATYGRALHEAERVIGPLQAATPGQLIAYRRSLAGQSSATIARKLATCSAYLRFLRQTGIRTDDPMLAIRRPKVDRLRAIRPLTADQCLRLIEACQDDRERALLWLLLHGLRVAEVVNLDADSLAGDELRIVGKGGRVRLVVLEQDAAIAVRAYLGLRRSGPLLTGTQGRLTTRQAQRILAQVSGRIGDEIAPHTLRHSFATQLVRSGTNLAVVQAMLGHASPATTAVYVRIDPATIRDEMRRAPLASRAAAQRLTVLPGGDEEGPEATPLGRQIASGQPQGTR
jgi:integrase/recombinase XerC